MNPGGPAKAPLQVDDRGRAAVVEPSDGSTSTRGDSVLMPVAAASVALSSGRRYDIEAGAEVDRLVVRSGSGDVLLEIGIGARGPRLRFESAELELVGARRLSLAAEEISVRAEKDLRVDVGGSLEERVGEHRHTTVAGDNRLEARAVEVLARESNVELLAMRDVCVDGERVALNGKPAPAPFPWSALASDD